MTDPQTHCIFINFDYVNEDSRFLINGIFSIFFCCFSNFTQSIIFTTIDSPIENRFFSFDCLKFVSHICWFKNVDENEIPYESFNGEIVAVQIFSPQSHTNTKTPLDRCYMWRDRWTFFIFSAHQSTKIYYILKCC